MGEKLNNTLMGMIPAAAGSIFGIAMQGANDRRQIRQQEKLQHMQIQGNKEMMDYQKMKELEMWKNTSYPAQMEMMKKAGINPALMYGMGGGGGTTVGGSSGGVSGASAPQGGGEVFGAMGIGLQTAAQIELLKAQKENIEADTANKTGDAANKPKVGANLDANTANINIGTELKKVELQIQNKTWDDQVDIIGNAAQKGFEEVSKLNRENRFGNEAYETQLKTLKEQLGTILLTQNLIKAQTKTEQGKPAVQAAEIELMKQQASATFRGINLAWERLSMDMTNSGHQNRKLDNDKLMNDVAASEKVPVELVGGLLKAGLIGAGLHTGGTKVTETYGPRGTTQRYEWYQD